MNTTYDRVCLALILVANLPFVFLLLFFGSSFFAFALFGAFNFFLVKNLFFKPTLINFFYLRTTLQLIMDKPIVLSQLRLFDSVGITFHNGYLGDISLSFRQNETKSLSRALSVLHSFDRKKMRGNEAISFDVMECYLQNLLKGRKYGIFNFPIYCDSSLLFFFIVSCSLLQKRQPNLPSQSTQWRSTRGYRRHHSAQRSEGHKIRSLFPPKSGEDPKVR